MRKVVFALLLFLPTLALANTPGRKVVVLTWDPAAGNCIGACTSNIYRGAAAGVCNGTPTPILSAPIGATTITDSTVTPGTWFYNVSHVNPATGGESTCDGEVQATVPIITTSPATGLAASVP